MGMTARSAAVAKALFAVTVWGASFIATKIALAEVAPVTVVWLRFAIGVAILGAFVAGRRQFVLPTASDLSYFTLLGFLGHRLPSVVAVKRLEDGAGEHHGLDRLVDAGLHGSPRLAGAPRAGARARRGGDRGRRGRRAAGGVARRLPALAAGRFGSIGASGDLLILASAPNWAVFSVLSRRGLRRFPSAGMMFWVMATGWLLTTVLFLATGPGSADIARLGPRGWGAVLFLGVCYSGLAYAFWYDALRELPASQAGASLYLEPLVAVVVAAGLLGEPVALAALAGGAAILLGVWMVERRVR
jgi:drug/metabolite transporter (DMT)-like permease